MNKRWVGEPLSPANIDAYAETLVSFGFEAVLRAIEDAENGRIARNNAFIVSAPELAERAEVWRRRLSGADRNAIRHRAIGADYGHGMVKMGGLSEEHQAIIDRSHGIINGRNAALMSRDELLAELDKMPKLLPLQKGPLSFDLNEVLEKLQAAAKEERE
jgi:hypothetical protein